MKKSTLLIILVFLSSLFAQRTPDPNVGHADNRRQGTMDGNLVRTLFINWGEIAHWPDAPSCEWPKGSGHQYVDGVALAVQAHTFDKNGQVIYPLETQYREFVDKSPLDELWGWAPLPGYFDPKGSEPAMSDDSDTWPASWPDKPAEWDGYWNGFFGKGVKNADLETFFVFDDDPDEEWDFYPDPTDTERRGLGLEVSSRLFQWHQVLAEDCIFAIYFITNEGKTDYDSTYYVFYIDWGIGGTDDSSDDTGDYNTRLDIAWAYDYDGFGTPGRWSPVGVCGFAFLESPGIETDGRDNDEDGVIDEKRDSGPGMWLDTYPYGVFNPSDFESYYLRAPKPHWSGDEDQDWDGYEDVNSNGEWDPGEPLNDDLGEDGIGPYHEGYIEPDNGEADGMPTAGEPDFDYTDKDESDQIGLTGFQIFPVHTYELWNEEQDWKVFRSAPPAKDALKVTANLGMFFSSGPFGLEAGQTKNYSMALIFADDADDLSRSKRTVQQIYNADYRFAKPPDKPQLIAIPGDGKVTLYWDERAELSFDPFLQEYDFEGYKIFRTTDSEFLESRIITDAYGRLTYRKPIAQFDLVNGINGLHPVDFEGVKYNLGEDTGLRHSYIDTDVQNGQTYYYAVVSYDKGFIDTSLTTIGNGIQPSECASVIKEDIAGNIQVDVNTAVVTPNPPAAGYIEPELDGDIQFDGDGTGSFDVSIIIPDSVSDGSTYEVRFYDDEKFHTGPGGWFSIYDVTGGERMLYDSLAFLENEETPIFNGISCSFSNQMDVEFDENNSGWLIGHSNYLCYVDLDPRFTNTSDPSLTINLKYPSDYEIRFYDHVVDTSRYGFGFPAEPVKFTVWDITENKQAEFFFWDFIEDSTLTPDSDEGIVIYIYNPDFIYKFNTSWRFYMETDTTLSVQVPPQEGDIFRIHTLKPFRTGDKFTFSMNGQYFDRETAEDQMDRICVVPNPYVAAASWEARSNFRFGRGERKIWFNNLPQKCTIRIYTVRGYLVDTIEHNDSLTNGSESWDLISKDGMDIAYGVYIFHVEAPGLGEKIGKFAVIK